MFRVFTTLPIALALVGCGATMAHDQSVAIASQSGSAPVRQGGDRIILLGTKGGPVADPTRSEPASLLVIGGTPYLIDAGAGTLHRLAEAGFEPASLSSIFITHHHLDHTAGLGPLLSLNWINTGLGGSEIEEVGVYGPPATAELTNAVLAGLAVSERIFKAGIPSLPAAKDRFVGHDMAPGRIYADENVIVTATENSHFSHRSTGPDGQLDRSYSYRFDTVGGSVVFTGDTGPSEAVVELAKDADILVSEVLNPIGRDGSVRSGETADELAEHMTLEHLTGFEVGKLAAAAGVGRLVLYHLVGNMDARSQALVLANVRKSYAGDVVFGEDLMEVPISAAH